MWATCVAWLKRGASFLSGPKLGAQFIAVCRRSKFGYTRTSRLRRGSPLCTRLALKRRGDTQRLSQVLRATKCDKLSEVILLQYLYIYWSLANFVYGPN